MTTEATHVCAYEGRVGICVDDSSVPVPLSPTIYCIDDARCDAEEEDSTCDRSRVIRNVRGASCTTCVPATGCLVNEVCEVLGGVCGDSEQQTECQQKPVDQSPACPVESMTRCQKNGDCPSGEKCILNARVECNTCTETAWKYREGGKKGDGLYDLASNPEESTKQFKSDAKPLIDHVDPEGNGHVNCFDDKTPIPSKIDAVQDVLKPAVDDWLDCIEAESCDDERCEDSPTCS